MPRLQWPPLAQGELKLCSYTLESCAAAVLQRRVPRIPHVHLVRWFNDGPAGASPLMHMLKRAIRCHTMTRVGCESSRRRWQMTALRCGDCLLANKHETAMKYMLAFPVNVLYMLMTGGRWRTVEHWVSRARMALHMTEQLDLAGRTGEMARPLRDETSCLAQRHCVAPSGMLCTSGHPS